MAKHDEFTPGSGPAAAHGSHDGAALGELWALRGDRAHVRLADGRTLACLSTVPLGPAALGRRVLVTFAGLEAVVTGVLQPLGEAPSVTVLADGHTVTLEADKTLRLRCGEASIALHRDGFVEIRGVDILSAAQRGHAIKGGSIDLN